MVQKNGLEMSGYLSPFEEALHFQQLSTTVCLHVLLLNIVILNY